MTRALSKLPELRFVTVSDFAREFEEACKERPAADILVGTAPGVEQNAVAPGPVSLVGGQAFATPVRSAYSSTYVSAVRSVGETRRRRSLLVVLLLLILCGGGAAAYFTYVKPAAPMPKKKVVKVSKKRARRSTGGAAGGSRSRFTSQSYSGPTAVPDAAPTASDEPADTQEEPTAEPDQDVDHETSPTDDAGTPEPSEGNDKKDAGNE